MTSSQLSDSLLRDPRVAIRQELVRALKSNSSGEPLRLSQPHNLYLVPDQANAYLALMHDNEYTGAFHDPVKNLISANVGCFVSGLKAPISVLDLGPGYPDKTLPIFDFLLSQNTSFTYFPVDISETFLNMSTMAAHKHHVPVTPLRCLFEDLPSTIDNITRNYGSRLVILGLTFMNFMPSEVAGILVPLIRTTDSLVVATELIQANPTRAITAPYNNPNAERFNRKLLELAGLDSQLFQYVVDLNHHNIEIGFITSADVAFEGTTIAVGTKLITATSYRYSVDELKDLLVDAFGEVTIIEDQAHSVALAVVRVADNPSRRSPHVQHNVPV